MRAEATATFRGEGGVDWSLALPLGEAMLDQIERGTLVPVGEDAEALLEQYHGAEFAEEVESESEGTAEVKASPAAAKLAEELGVDLDTVKGTGKNGVVTKGDVEDAETQVESENGDGDGDGDDPEE